MAQTDGSSDFDDQDGQLSDSGGDNPMTAMFYQANASTHHPSNNSGLSAPSFALERRGYDRAAVDAFVAQAASAYQRVSKDAAESKQQISELGRRLDEMQEELDEHERPTYGGLGKHAAAMLRLAEEQATQVTHAANEAAKEMRSRANREATALVSQAQQEAEQIRSTRQAELDRHHTKLRTEAEELKAAATSDAKEIVAAARREAEQIRLAAEQETATARTAAVREAEQLRASADREAQEARRALALERERLAKEAASYHASATERTQRLVADAETRAAAAERRAAEALELSTNHREQASAEADKIVAAARRDAEQLVATAKAQAAQITAKANHESDETHAIAEDRIDLLRRRRDGILAQLAQLRELVGSFATDDPNEDFIPRTPWSRRTRPAESEYSFDDQSSSAGASGDDDTNNTHSADTSVIESVAGDGTEPADSDIPEQPRSKVRAGGRPLASVESEPDDGWQGGSATADQLTIDEDEEVDAPSRR